MRVRKMRMMMGWTRKMINEGRSWVGDGEGEAHESNKYWRLYWAITSVYYYGLTVEEV